MILQAVTTIPQRCHRIPRGLGLPQCQRFWEVSWVSYNPIDIRKQLVYLFTPPPRNVTYRYQKMIFCALKCISFQIWFHFKDIQPLVFGGVSIPTYMRFFQIPSITPRQYLVLWNKGTRWAQDPVISRVITLISRVTTPVSPFIRSFIGVTTSIRIHN